ncbi:MAG: ComEC/Rec2 family competence protein [Capsulimonas sp.]|uniref:ComEC/Rec2 family competence protein n=1 Tax=Capsulimonas sp. TaxID=2494211 RepID=UPI0032636FE3
MKLRYCRLLVILVAAGLLTSCARDPDAGKLRVTVIDVGQGDSILVETPTGHAMLIDGGGSNRDDDSDPRHVGLRTVVPYLRYRGIDHLDAIVLTHPHADHVGGLPDILREVRTDAVLDGTALPFPSPAYAAFLTEVRNRHIPYRRVVRGTHIDFGDGVTADALNPPPGHPYGTATDNATMNNYSAVFLLTYGKTHILLDGDAQFEAEQNMLATYPNLRADVLKCGHHGAANSTSDAWLERVRPKYAAISCSRTNSFGHPSPATLARLKAHGVQTYVTAANGAIVFVSDGRSVKASGTVTK